MVSSDLARMRSRLVKTLIKNFNTEATQTSKLKSRKPKLLVFSRTGSNIVSAAKDLIACGVKLGKLSSNYKLYGHRQAVATLCPGDTLFAEITKWPHWTAGHA